MRVRSPIDGAITDDDIVHHGPTKHTIIMRITDNCKRMTSAAAIYASYDEVWDDDEIWRLKTVFDDKFS